MDCTDIQSTSMCSIGSINSPDSESSEKRRRERTGRLRNHNAKLTAIRGIAKQRAKVLTTQVRGAIPARNSAERNRWYARCSQLCQLTYVEMLENDVVLMEAAVQNEKTISDVILQHNLHLRERNEKLAEHGASLAHKLKCNSEQKSFLQQADIFPVARMHEPTRPASNGAFHSGPLLPVDVLVPSSDEVSFQKNETLFQSHHHQMPAQHILNSCYPDLLETPKAQYQTTEHLTEQMHHEQVSGIHQGARNLGNDGPRSLSSDEYYGTEDTEFSVENQETPFAAFSMDLSAERTGGSIGDM